MLLGGAVTDRLSPRTVMIASNLVRAVAVGLLAALVVWSSAGMAHLLALSVIFGAVDAFYHPSLLAIVPSLVSPRRLDAANAWVQGSEQAAQLLGPGAAGWLVARGGLGTAFAVDTVTFVFVVVTLLAMRLAWTHRARDGEAMLAQIASALRYVTGEPVIRALLVAVALLNFAVTGPAAVALPMLAAARFSGAASFGIMMSVLGASSLVGAVLASSLLRGVALGRLMIAATTLFGLATAGVGMSPNLGFTVPALGLMGLCIGLLNVRTIAWLQGRADPAFRGRVLSLVTFASVGLAPLSLAVTRAAMRAGFGLLFTAAGGLIVVVTVMAAAIPPIRRIGRQTATTP